MAVSLLRQSPPLIGLDLERFYRLTWALASIVKLIVVFLIPSQHAGADWDR